MNFINGTVEKHFDCIILLFCVNLLSYISEFLLIVKIKCAMLPSQVYRDSIFYGNYSLPSSFNTKHLASFLSQGNKEVVVKYEHQPFGIQSL